MSSKLKVSKNYSIDGFSYKNDVTIETDGRVSMAPSVPSLVPKAGTITTRSDNDTGVATLSGGHGLTTGDKVDVYWNGGSRRNMACTVSVNAVTIDGGSGDNLPVLSTAVQLVIPQQENFALVGDDMQGLVLYSPVRGCITLLDGSGGVLYSVELDANETIPWITGDGTNPVAGDTVAKIKFSHITLSSQVMEAYAFIN